MSSVLPSIVKADIDNITTEWIKFFEPLINKGQITRETYDKVYNAMLSISKTTESPNYVSQENLEKLKSLRDDIHTDSWEKKPTTLTQETVYVYSLIGNIVDKIIARMHLAILLQKLKKLCT